MMEAKGSLGRRSNEVKTAWRAKLTVQPLFRKYPQVLEVFQLSLVSREELQGREEVPVVQHLTPDPMGGAGSHQGKAVPPIFRYTCDVLVPVVMAEIAHYTHSRRRWASLSTELVPSLHEAQCPISRIVERNLGCHG